ncbi:MAG: ABC transporter permease [Candidatus Hodarchaeales archaeon]
MSDLINPLIGSSIVIAATFFVIPTVGEIISERSGILNLGIEGMIIASAAGSYSIAFQTGNLYFGILFGILLGGLLAFVHGIITITFNRNQVVSGIGLTILGTGLSGILGKDVVGKSLTGLQKIAIPHLSEIPTIGPIFFNQTIIVYFSYLLAPFIWFILYKTRIGILIRTVGENPNAAYNQGVNVRLIRYLSLVFGGMCAGLGGAYLSLSWLTFWSDGMTNARGWIVIALVVVALWNPLGAFLGSFVFGAFDVLRFSFQNVSIPFLFPSGLDPSILEMLPHVITILFLAVWGLLLSRQKVKSIVGAPTALAVPFEE